MQTKFARADRDLTLLHALFGFTALFALNAEVFTLGWRITGLVIFYNLLLPAFARAVNYSGWLELWTYLLPLSILMIAPDWFLAEVLGVLVFPDTGAPFVGPVPIFMGGMWVVPLFIIIYIGRRFRGRYAPYLAGLASGVIFLASEATLWQIPIWMAQNVAQVGHVAWYLVAPLTMLGVFALWGFEWSLGKSFWHKLAAGFLVMLTYIGNTGLFYLLVERVMRL